MDGGLERLKVLSCWEDCRRKKVPVSRCHRDKRIDEWVCSVSIKFKRLGVLNLRKSCISRKWSLWGDHWFYLVRIKPMVISIKRERVETDLRWAMESRVSVNIGSPIVWWPASELHLAHCRLQIAYKPEIWFYNLKFRTILFFSATNWFFNRIFWKNCLFLIIISIILYPFKMCLLISILI